MVVESALYLLRWRRHRGCVQLKAAGGRMQNGNEPTTEWYAAAFKNLIGDAQGTIALSSMIVGSGLLVWGLPPLVACGFPGAIYIVYGLRTFIDNGHQRKLAEIEVRKIEAESGIKAKEKLRRSLERRQKRDGTH